MLLAPNGNPSNLNAEQYKLVRTPQFKAFFGDWEKLAFAKFKDFGMDEITLANLSKDVSKVVDENGEPLILWHFAKRLQGENERFNTFKVDRQLGAHFGSMNQVKNLKFYNNDRNLRKPNIDKKNSDYRFFQVFLNIKNPLRMKDEGIFEPETLANALDNIEKLKLYDWEHINNYTHKSKDSILDRIKYIATTNRGFDGAVYLNRYESTDDMALVNKLDDASDKVFKEKLPNSEDSWIAFYPEQIKLADGSNTTFDESNPDIRYEQGGELAKGIKAEMEHKGTIDKFKRAGVSDKDVATSIAKDHLKEDPKYYTKLMKLEEKLALGGSLLERKMANGGNIEIQPIRELGTGAKVYFETPFYRVNSIGQKNRYVLLVGMENSGGYMYEYTYYYDNVEIPNFVAKELSKIYPNGVPDSVKVDETIEVFEKKWEADENNEIYSNEDNMEIEEKPHHGISINVSDYKNPYEVNRAIEKLLNEKGSEQESYTPDEINFLSYYSGYGGLEKQGTFSQDELKGLLYEYFTPDEIVKKMWGLAYKYGYGSIGDNSVFEPSVGVGAFLKYAPDNVFVAANEINRYSAMICHILYPNVRTTLMPFERNFILRNMSVKKNIESMKKYSLVIGNPPYGKLGGIYMPMGEDKYSGASNWAEYFLFRGLDLLQKGGLLIYIIGAEQYNGGTLFLDAALTTTKKAIFEKADLIDAYRLPNKIFERTGVSSEIVIFRKR